MRKLFWVILSGQIKARAVVPDTADLKELIVHANGLIVDAFANVQRESTGAWHILIPLARKADSL
jgi:hypothetical protein